MLPIRKKVVKTILDIVSNNFTRITEQYGQNIRENLNRKKSVFIHHSSGIHDVEIKGECKTVVIEENVQSLKYCNFLVRENASLIIRKNVFFNNYCSVTSMGFIEIGENSIFGEGVKIYDHNHAFTFDEKQLKIERDEFKIGSVIIGNNCWIGSNSTILNNVNIGDNVLIGANCLIYKSIPSNSVVKAKIENILNSLSIETK